MTESTVVVSSPEKPFWQQLIRRLDLGLLVIAVLYLVVNAFYLNFVPMWDGDQYSEFCIIPAIDKPFNPLNFSCFDHPSMLYILLIAWPQYLGYANLALLHLPVLLLNLASVWAFYKIAVLLFPDAEKSLGLYLVTFCFAFQPVILASTLNINPDQGVVIFLMLYLYALLYRKMRLAILFGTIFVLTKEMGLLLYPVITGFYFLVFVFEFRQGFGSMVKAVVQRLYFLIPLLVFGLYILLRVLVGLSPFWVGTSTAISYIHSPLYLFDDVFATYMNIIFVLSFSWIFTLLIVVSFLIWLYHWRVKRRALSFKTEQQKAIGFILLVFVALIFIITRFETYANPRYLVGGYPLFFLTFYMAWRYLPLVPWAKLGWLGLGTLLLFWSDFATVDPVSKAIYGTFQFGDHQLLNMTSLTGECCGYGEDQIVYNYEYTRISDLQNQIYADIKPTSSTAMITNFYNAFRIQPGFLDPVTFQRTISTKGLLFHYWTIKDASQAAQQPKEIYFIEMPNYPRTGPQGELSSILQYYDTAWTKTYDSGGYKMNLSKLTLRTGN